MSDWNTLIVDAGPAARDWLTPGRVLRAFSAGAQVSADAMGPLRPWGPGQVAALVPATVAVKVRTPLPVSVDGGLVMIRREDDAPSLDRADVAGQVSGTIEAPGALAAAVADALGEGYGAEDLGLTLDAGGRLMTDLPPMSASRLPAETSLSGATIAWATDADPGKKNG